MKYLTNYICAVSLKKFSIHTGIWFIRLNKNRSSEIFIDPKLFNETIRLSIIVQARSTESISSLIWTWGNRERNVWTRCVFLGSLERFFLFAIKRNWNCRSRISMEIKITLIVSSTFLVRLQECLCKFRLYFLNVPSRSLSFFKRFPKPNFFFFFFFHGAK